MRALADTLEVKLGLTAQQKSGVADILTREYEAMAASRRENPGADKVKEMVAKACADTDGQIKDLLTPEQQTQYAGLVQSPGGIFGVTLTPGAGRLSGEEGSSHK